MTIQLQYMVRNQGCLPESRVIAITASSISPEAFSDMIYSRAAVCREPWNVYIDRRTPSLVAILRGTRYEVRVRIKCKAKFGHVYGAIEVYLFDRLQRKRLPHSHALVYSASPKWRQHLADAVNALVSKLIREQ